MAPSLAPLLCARSRFHPHGLEAKVTPIDQRPDLEVAHSILKDHNLPYGLLPMASLLSINFCEATGRFSATHPEKECEAVFGGHRIKFDRTISGVITKNFINDLKGIRVKCCIVWLAIKAVHVDAAPGTNIHFCVGPFTASLPVQELWDYKFWPDAFRSEEDEGAEGRGAEGELPVYSPTTLAAKALQLLSPRSRVRASAMKEPLKELASPA